MGGQAKSKHFSGVKDGSGILNYDENVEYLDAHSAKGKVVSRTKSKNGVLRGWTAHPVRTKDGRQHGATYSHPVLTIGLGTKGRVGWATAQAIVDAP